jgi:hypothetical protein
MLVYQRVRYHAQICPNGRFILMNMIKRRRKRTIVATIILVIMMIIVIINNNLRN